MRILNVFDSFDSATPSGGRTYTRIISRALTARGHEVTVLTPRAVYRSGPAALPARSGSTVGGSKPTSGAEGTMVTSDFALCLRGSFKPPRAFWKRVPDLVKLLGDCDIVNAAPPGSSLPYVTLLSRRAVGRSPPFITIGYVHTETHDVARPEREWLYRKADGILVETPYEKGYLTSKLGVEAGKVAVIASAVDMELSEAGAYGRIPLPQDVNEGAYKVLWLGRRAYRKGFYHVLSAMPYVWRHLPDATLMVAGPVAGKGFSGPLAEASNEVLSRNLNRRIFDFGVVDDDTRKKLLASCDALVLPSLGETIPEVVLEAWAFNKPAICADIPTVRSVAGEGEGIHYCKFGEVESIGRAIVEMGDPEARKRLGDAGNGIVRKTFTFDSFAKRVEDAYTSYGLRA
ncbi:MAG: glycosyltransferase family 4 protein [Nitrososphaerota archaeon]|nr:glycosyltransferase family 4 protein [Nitrososphaerota archaeon]